ncbi:hypothetical protein E2933_26630 [Escherichia coli]|nr:hypothetical protein [Escherichia coli]
MLGGADNPNGELPSYITGANNAGLTALKRLYEGTAGLSVFRQSLFPYWHCAGMNNQAARKVVSLRERG